MVLRLLVLVSDHYSDKPKKGSSAGCLPAFFRSGVVIFSAGFTGAGFRQSAAITGAQALAC
ncbi:hypothetical protein [Psychromonas sp. MME1]|uniref:hypothetical protein n=1 Tax=Psychromonas sp. MME1 TaxID=3231032 RepID=UPI0034E1C038